MRLLEFWSDLSYANLGESQHQDPSPCEIPTMFATSTSVHETTHFFTRPSRKAHFNTTNLTSPTIMAHLPKAVPYPVRYVSKPKPSSDCDVIRKQLVGVLEHRASSTKETAETSPTSSYGTVPEQPNDETEIQTSPTEGPKTHDASSVQDTPKPLLKNSRPEPFLVSSAFLQDVPDSQKTPMSKAQEVPAYPMSKENIRPHDVWVTTGNVPAKYLSFAFLTEDQTDYIKTLQENWDNTSKPPIRPEAPLGTTLNKALNAHAVNTKERIPPGQAWRVSNSRCVRMVEAWERVLRDQEPEPGSTRTIEIQTNIQKCRELREELLSQRSNVEEMVSIKILLARAVWQQEAFKQIKKERNRIEELEVELAQARREKLFAEEALLHAVEKRQAENHTKHLDAFAEHINRETQINDDLLADWDKCSVIFPPGQEQPADAEKITKALSMFGRTVAYIQDRRTGLQEERELLGKFVDIKTFRHDKANLIDGTMEMVVHDVGSAKEDVETRLEAAKATMASWSTVTSPGLPGMPSPPLGAAAYDSRQDMETRIENLEVEKSTKAYEHAVALMFSKYWKLYHSLKIAKGDSMDLSDEEEEEVDYEDDSDYEEDPCPETTAHQLAAATAAGHISADNIAEPACTSAGQSMQWFYDIISHACKTWTEDVVRHRTLLEGKQRENDKFRQSLEKSTVLWKKLMFQNGMAGRMNRRLRQQVKELESRIGEYIDFMQKLGIGSDKDVKSEECLYTSIQALKALKDENLRSKILIDGLNERVADLSRALDLCEEAMVPWPSTNRLEESLSEGLQVYDHMFSQHKSWLRGLGKTQEESSIDDEEIKDEVEDAAEMFGDIHVGTSLPSDSNSEGDVFTDGFAMLAAMAEGKPIPNLRARMTASRHISPERRQPPGPYDEHSKKELEVSEMINVAKTFRARGGSDVRPGDELITREVHAMKGLVELKEGRSTKFVERFDDGENDEGEGGAYERLRME